MRKKTLAKTENKANLQPPNGSGVTHTNPAGNSDSPEAHTPTIVWASFICGPHLIGDIASSNLFNLLEPLANRPANMGSKRTSECQMQLSATLTWRDGVSAHTPDCNNSRNGRCQRLASLDALEHMRTGYGLISKISDLGTSNNLIPGSGDAFFPGG